MLTKKIVAALACALVLGLPCVAVAANAPASSADTKAAAEKPADTKDAAAQKADASKTSKGADDAAAPAAGPSDELVAWAEGMACEACHADQAASVEDEACTMAVHAPLELDCVACHADDALMDVHAKAKADAKLPTKLKKTKVADGCATCHATEALIEATADSEALTDSEGTVVNPHDLPAVKDHKSFTCDACHKMHTSDSPANRAATQCVSCHHEDVYECYTCHS